MSEKNIRDVVAFLRGEEYPNTAQGLEEQLEALLAEHHAALAAAESRGYERAREQAAGVVEARAREWLGIGNQAMSGTLSIAAADIRTMTDERNGERLITESEIAKRGQEILEARRFDASAYGTGWRDAVRGLLRLLSIDPDKK